MNRVELFLKNGILYKRLDFDDNLTINKTFYDLSNPYKSQLGYSFSSKLPLTKLNRELLGYDVKVNKKYDVKIYVNDIEITDGYIIIQNKNSKELTFNYVDASSEILSRLDRDYIFNATIDTEAIMGRNYLIPSNIYNVMDYPLLIDIINSSTPYKIGVANDGKKDLYLYVTDLISFNETLTPESKKISTRYTSYENDLTNAPVIFSKNNFYLSVNVEFLLNTLFDDHLDNYKVLSNSNAFRDFIKNNYVILKKDNINTISRNFTGINNPVYGYFQGKDIFDRPTYYIDPFDNFNYKLSDFKEQTVITLSNLRGPGSIINLQYINVTDSIKYFNLNYLFRLFNSSSYVELKITIISVEGTLVFEKYINYNTISTITETEFLNNILPNYTLNIQVYNFNIISPYDISLEIVETDSTGTPFDFNYILQDTYNFNIRDLINLIAEQTNCRISISKNIITLIDNDFKRNTIKLNKSNYIETEEVEVNLKGIKINEELIENNFTYVFNQDLNYIDSSFLALSDSEVILSILKDPEYIIKNDSNINLNYKNNYTEDIQDILPVEIPYVGGEDDINVQRIYKDILNLSNVNPDNISKDYSNYITDYDYCRLNLGYTVFNKQNKKIATLDDVEGIIIERFNISTNEIVESYYYRLNESFVDTGITGFYIQNKGNHKMRVVLNTSAFSSSILNLSDFINTTYDIKLKISSRGNILSKMVTLTGTPPSTSDDLLELIYDTFVDLRTDYYIEYPGTTPLLLSHTTGSGFIEFNVSEEQSSYYFECILTRTDDGTVVTNLLLFSETLYFNQLTSIDRFLNFGAIKVMDFPPQPILTKLAYEGKENKYRFEIYQNFSNGSNNFCMFLKTLDNFSNNDLRNKIIEPYAIYQLDVDNGDFNYVTNNILSQDRKRTTDSELDLGKPYILVDGEYVLSNPITTSSSIKPFYTQFKWVPDFDYDFIENKVNIDDIIFCTIDNSYPLKGSEEFKVYLNYKNQYSLYCPLFYKSCHYSLRLNNINSFIFNNLYNKELDTFETILNISDYLQLLNQNSLIRVNEEEYYLINMEYNFKTNRAKIRVIKKIDFSN